MARRAGGAVVRLESPAGTHLTYCTNIHPGESRAEVLELLRSLVPDVKRRVSPNAAFGVGLRLAAQAASELEAPGALEELRSLLDDAGLYVFTLNGFPYGAFHRTRVKESVYLPDWFEQKRVDYTASLGRVLARLLPPGVPGSISTVPGCFAPRAIGPDAHRLLAVNIARAAAELVRIERETGQFIALALEPEPACFLETTAQAVRFFNEDLFGAEGCASFAALTGLAAPAAERALRRHVGVCLDTCHGSVEFERPVDGLAALRRAGIAVPKIQISAGLRLQAPDAERLRELRAFDDGVYLHQTVVRTGAGALVRFVDLPAALEAAATLGADSEWRVHFHVPVFESALGAFSSTQADVIELLSEADELAPHLEVETYTFDVLPAAFRGASVTEAVARELAWTLGVLAERGARA
jgi:sugar phosphate isomerase/epimerase